MGADRSMGSAPPRCPGDEAIARFVEGALPPSSHAQIRAHIGECAQCRQLVSALCADRPPADSSSSEEGELDVEVGTILGGKYEVLRILGSGGMGKVLAARHLDLGHTVAIKVMHAEVAKDATFVRRFLREGRAAALLRSENAARIHDVGRFKSGVPFLVMEHLDGEDLHEVSKRERLPVATVIDYLLQAIAAIAEAHERGLVHRDIKPQNLFLAKLSDGATRVKVLDFGLAKDLELLGGGSGVLTTENMILGSPHFMSPEQIRAPAGVDRRADVWAIGASMYQLLTGKPPYESNTVHGVLALILSSPPPKLRLARPDAPRALEAIIERCMQREVTERFGSVTELAAALKDAGDPSRTLGHDGPGEGEERSRISETLPIAARRDSPRSALAIGNVTSAIATMRLVAAAPVAAMASSSPSPIVASSSTRADARPRARTWSTVVVLIAVAGAVLTMAIAWRRLRGDAAVPPAKSATGEPAMSIVEPPPPPPPPDESTRAALPLPASVHVEGYESVPSARRPVSRPPPPRPAAQPSAVARPVPSGSVSVPVTQPSSGSRPPAALATGQKD